MGGPPPPARGRAGTRRHGPLGRLGGWPPSGGDLESLEGVESGLVSPPPPAPVDPTRYRPHLAAAVEAARLAAALR